MYTRLPSPSVTNGIKAPDHEEKVQRLINKYKSVNKTAVLDLIEPPIPLYLLDKAIKIKEREY